ncbi:MAG: SpoIID/LytB domain protein [Candidatus Amesbacteria bacterium GW2011_GWB1_47_26]|uniref:SpoIID/LytB domain protein n=1 Tax=Candidatus Amesbacteria bacterium GW2011_GWC2_45_19 TaxID=1618366 RepID=A0A0G1M379_9BACT|nr:MAG: SpoIID/LytB domain protein [Candidatus Amesbacteria bacterium GW2011_GWC2_45_19]KKU69374.1 MAG: SpoIID/LytB domain protein [Microgenomates group bacterium GW2011_GWC1_47_20]KKU74526.1 MAG: SpoIID/LytB domain protein [Candidatus Amesbacteria bacterium GW2011_GWB1_47_26]
MVILATAGIVRADECDNISSLGLEQIGPCISKFSGFADAISKANATNSRELASLNTQISNLKAQINQLNSQIQKLQADVFERQVKIGVRETLLAARVKRDYIRKRDQTILTTLFADQTAQRLFADLAYREKLARDDRELIAEISGEIQVLRARGQVLSDQKLNVDALKKRVDDQAKWLAGEVAKANKYVSDLSGKIASLTARQNEILAARSGNFIASVGDSELSDDYNASIRGFREAAPGGSFAVFSFGAYTHQGGAKGMSQYGAKGRAQSGQDYNQILQAYYKASPVGKDTGGTISVAGLGNLNFEDYYLLGIAEMPSSFPMPALKAQAIAARTYAYRYKIGGKSICTDEYCQVFRKSKADNPPSEWRTAVQETRGQVLDGVVTYYSSTTGGYITTMGWDTTDGGGGANFFDKSYEKIGGSPWAYKAWYRKGYSPSGDSCGRDNPWLSSEEMADIINAALYRDDRVTPITTSCWGGNPYSYSELRSKANGPLSVSSVYVSLGNGRTNEVVFQTDKGEIRLSGSDFKTAFNLRAPGRLQIPQSGFAFFNIERK